MSLSVIYSIVLACVYLLYLGIRIILDVLNKNSKKKDTIEINVADESGEDLESSTIVEETDGGYKIRSDRDSVEENSDTESGSSDENQVDFDHDEEVSVDMAIDDERILEEESQQDMEEYHELMSVQNQMLSVSPSYQDEYGSDEFAVLMSQPISNKNKILRNIVHL